MYHPMHLGDYSQHESPTNARSHENELMGNVYAKCNVHGTIRSSVRIFILCYAVKCIKYIFGNHFCHSVNAEVSKRRNLDSSSYCGC